MNEVSSPTPEGRHGRCPVCDHYVRIEPSRTHGGAPCPDCGHVLCFFRMGNREFVCPKADARAVRRRMQQRSADGRYVDLLNADSLDAVELVIELEEEHRLSAFD